MEVAFRGLFRSDTHRTFFFLKLRFAKGGQANIYSLDPGRRNSSKSAGDLVKGAPMRGYKRHALNHEEDLFLLGAFISIHFSPFHLEHRRHKPFNILLEITGVHLCHHFGRIIQAHPTSVLTEWGGQPLPRSLQKVHAGSSIGQKIACVGAQIFAIIHSDFFGSFL